MKSTLEYAFCLILLLLVIVIGYSLFSADITPTRKTMIDVSKVRL